MKASRTDRRGIPDLVSQEGAYLVTWVAAGATAAAVRVAAADDFRRYLGPLDPLLAVGIAGAAGLMALRGLRAADWLVEHGTDEWGIGPALVAAAGFGGAIVLADTFLGFPRDINVAWPTALFFYPAIGLVAEVVFHLVPLAGVVEIRRRRAMVHRRSRTGSAAVPIAVVAAVEAAFQVVFGGGGEHEPWLSSYLAVHMLGFGVAQLLLLRRRGFSAAMAMRMGYYLVWHIVWGRARLGLLF